MLQNTENMADYQLETEQCKKSFNCLKEKCWLSGECTGFKIDQSGFMLHPLGALPTLVYNGTASHQRVWRGGGGV